MKNHLTKLLVAIGFCAVIVTFPATAQQRPEGPLTNSSVVKLVRAGFKDKTVIAIINSRPSNFQLDPDRLIDLKRNGVSENIILTMLAHGNPQILDEDGWGDESFFRQGGLSGADKGDNRSGSNDIFGSGAESSSETKGRGMRGSGQGNTTTTGSATVRIIRPPSEAGEASMKLEKTPSLNNEAIVRLVDAGFSEGTIIKRIEDSPADFDLSPGKLDELRKRRVSEPIITAMMGAMGDAAPKSTSPGPGREN